MRTAPVSGAREAAVWRESAAAPPRRRAAAPPRRRAAARAKREQRRRTPVQLRPQYPDVDESIAVSAALSGDPHAGAVGLSSRPVDGDAASVGDDERHGLG